MKRLLCVWLPNWPVQRRRLETPLVAELSETQQATGGTATGETATGETANATDAVAEKSPDPFLLSDPFLLWDDHSRRGRLVVACCPRVRAARVRVGMSISQAHEMCLAAGLADVVIEKHDPLIDRQSLDQVAWWMQQTISPLVSIEALDDRPWAGHPRHQCESLVCDITGVSHLFGGEAGTLAKVTELLSSLGLAGRLAIAGTQGTAWAVSHHRIAKSHIPEDRCFIVPAGQDRSALEPLPVSALRIAPETAETLDRLGVETIGHLLQLPRSGLAPRLGTNLIRRIEHALGEVDEPTGVFRETIQFSETLSLEYSTTDLRILVDRVERLTTKVRAGLATRQRGALRMTCRLDLSAHPPLTLDVGLFAPTIDAKHLSGLINHRLEQVRLPSSVTGVTISAPLTGPLRTVQESLFDSAPCDSSLNHSSLNHWSQNHSSLNHWSLGGSAISRLIDSLSGRLGRNAVVEVKLSRDPLPESSYGLSPLAGNPQGANRTQSNRTRSRRNSRRRSFGGNSESSDTSSPPTRNLNPSPADALRRPLSLLASPLALSIAFGDQSFISQTSSLMLPDRLRFHGVTHNIIRVWGPERIETGWWKGPSINRDYFRVETHRSQWLWVFRGRIPQSSTDHVDVNYRWMLHGHFA